VLGNAPDTYGPSFSRRKSAVTLAGIAELQPFAAVAPIG
jgi:hypothetical protein